MGGKSDQNGEQGHKMSKINLVQPLRTKYRLITSKPATQKQVDFILKLGGAVPADLSAQAASEMIEQLIGAIDVDRIKAEISVRDLIGESFTVVSDGQRFTTDEHDSLKIFEHNNSWTWYSQDGKTGNHLGGSVIDWVMHTNGCGRGDAIVELWLRLNGRGGYVAPAPRPVVQKSADDITPYSWQSEHWQKSAVNRLGVVQERLQSGDAGRPCRDYLAGRGIALETTIAFGLGFGQHWNNKARSEMPALFMPWYVGGMISAISTRFLNVAKGDQSANRVLLAGYKLTVDATEKYYGERFLFGLQNVGTHGDTLILVEGELNCLSVYQCVKGRFACDVLSFGPQKNLQNAHVVGMAQDVASRYQRIIIWADRPQAAIDALGTIPNAYPVRSPEIDGKEHDANDLLQIGLLGDVLDGLLTDMGTTPAPVNAGELAFTLADIDPVPVDPTPPLYNHTGRPSLPKDMWLTGLDYAMAERAWRQLSVKWGASLGCDAGGFFVRCPGWQWL